MARPMMVGRAVQRYRTVAQVLWTPRNASTTTPALSQWDISDTKNVTLQGSNIASWIDGIGGLACSQSSASKQPVYATSSRNGKPGGIFTSSSRHSLGPSGQGKLPVGKAAHTVMIVGYVSGSGPQKCLFWGVAGGTARTFGNRNSFYESGTTGGGNDATTTIPWNAVDLVSVCDIDPTTLVTRNYANGSTTPQTISVGAANFASGGAYIGSFSDSQEYWNGVIQEIVIFSGKLSDSDRAKAFGYAAWKWGQVANLPASHPYKSRAPYVSDP